MRGESIALRVEGRLDMPSIERRHSQCVPINQTDPGSLDEKEAWLMVSSEIVAAESPPEGLGRGVVNLVFFPWAAWSGRGEQDRQAKDRGRGTLEVPRRHSDMSMPVATIHRGTRHGAMLASE